MAPHLTPQASRRAGPWSWTPTALPPPGTRTTPRSSTATGPRPGRG